MPYNIHHMYYLSGLTMGYQILSLQQKIALLIIDIEFDRRVENSSKGCTESSKQSSIK